MDQAELVGGVLFDAADPVAAGRVLFELLTSDKRHPEVARASGLEPALVESLRRGLPSDRHSLELACAVGAAWVLGRRSLKQEETWEAVATLPPGLDLPLGLRRTTGETIVSLASTAKIRIRLTAPYIDEPAIAFLSDSIASATRRGVDVELFDPRSPTTARTATARLDLAISQNGDSSRFRLVRTAPDAPFAHLKVMVADGTAAYIGSANITAAGLAGRNLELGVLVRGEQVAVIERVLDLYQRRG